MGRKDASAKQTQDYRDRFNHFDAPRVTLLVTLGSPRWFQDCFFSQTKWFRAYPGAGRTLQKNPVRAGSSGREVVTSSYEL